MTSNYTLGNQDQKKKKKNNNQQVETEYGDTADYPFSLPFLFFMRWQSPAQALSGECIDCPPRRIDGDAPPELATTAVSV